MATDLKIYINHTTDERGRIGKGGFQNKKSDFILKSDTVKKKKKKRRVAADGNQQ
jgi:hypothetical protein